MAIVSLPSWSKLGGWVVKWKDFSDIIKVLEERFSDIIKVFLNETLM